MRKIGFVTVILSIVLICGILPAFSLSASAETSGSCGENLTWVFDSSTGTLTISGTGEMDDYGSCSERPWEDCFKCVKSIMIEEGVTRIGSWAFYGYNYGSYYSDGLNLESVSFPDTLTSIGSYAFYDVEVENIAFPCHLETIEASAFAGNDKLTDLVIPSNVIQIGFRAFSSCENLETIVLAEGVGIPNLHPLKNNGVF